MVMQWTVNPPPYGTTGSIPVCSTNFIWVYCQSGQTARLGSERPQVRILPPRPDKCGQIAARGAQQSSKLIMRSSTLPTRSNLCLVSSAVVAPSLQVGCQWFDPTTRYQYANVAQMVEQRIENPCVTGSIPVFGTNFLHICKRINTLRRYIIIAGEIYEQKHDMRNSFYVGKAFNCQRHCTSFMFRH